MGTPAITLEQSTYLTAIEDVLKAVSVLDAYDSVVGIAPRNTIWRAVVDLVRHAVTTEQISPARIARVFHKNGFTEFQVGAHGNIIHVRQNPNQLSRSLGTPHRW